MERNLPSISDPPTPLPVIQPTEKSDTNTTLTLITMVRGKNKITGNRYKLVWKGGFDRDIKFKVGYRSKI